MSTSANARGLAAVAEAALSSSAPAALAVADQSTAKAAPDAAADHTAALSAARAEGKAEGAKEGVTSERTRIKAVVSSDKYKGREALAHSLAFSTDLSAEQIVAALGEAPEARQSRLDGNVPAPKVAAEESTTDERASVKAGLSGAVQKQIALRASGKTR